MNPAPPDDNPIYAALSALAPAKDWASVSPQARSRPNRVRIQLRLHHAKAPLSIELKLGSEREGDDAWAEFNEWFVAFSTFDSSAEPAV